MYEFLDRPVDHLGNGGRFVLWAMRGWTGAMAKGACAPVSLTHGFAGTGSLCALPQFHVAMSLLDREGLEKLALSPMSCPQIGDTEALLVTLWRDAGLGLTEKLHETLALLVADDAVAPIARAMIGAAAQLAIAGLDISDVNPETQKEKK